MLVSRTSTRELVSKSAFGSGSFARLEEKMDSEVYPPGWLPRWMSYGLQMTARSTSGWKYTIQAFRVITGDSMIFDLCPEGNLSAIDMMFRKGETSPWDRDPDGQTLLRVTNLLLFNFETYH